MGAVIHPGNPALTGDRLSHVDQNYIRADTHAAANARGSTATARGAAHGPVDHTGQRLARRCPKVHRTRGT